MRLVVSISIICLILGCQEVIQPKKPENLIKKEKMAQIIAESYTGNAARSINNRVLRDAGLRLDSLLYAKYEVDSLNFAESNTYYASQLNDYIEIMSMVEKILDTRKISLDSILEAGGISQRDSIMKVKAQTSKSDSVETEGLIAPATDGASDKQ